MRAAPGLEGSAFLGAPEGTEGLGLTQLSSDSCVRGVKVRMSGWLSQDGRPKGHVHFVLLRSPPSSLLLSLTSPALMLGSGQVDD